MPNLNNKITFKVVLISIGWNLQETTTYLGVANLEGVPHSEDLVEVEIEGQAKFYKVLYNVFTELGNTIAVFERRGGYYDSIIKYFLSLG